MEVGVPTDFRFGFERKLVEYCSYKKARCRNVV